MIKKLFAFTLALLFALNASVVFGADTKKPKAKKSATAANKTTIAATQQANALLASLPASDGVASVDLQRLLNEALPQILAANPEKLAEINAQIDRVKEQTGFDVRQFEQIALGVAFRGKTADPIMLARGKYNAPALLALAKIATKGKHREEKSGDKSITVFDAKEILAEHKAKLSGGGSLVKILDFILNKMPGELAVATFDSNTLAIGSVARVREIFESKTRVSAGVLSLVNARKPNSMVSFGANTPNGLAQFFELDEDEFGQSLTSIRQIYGALSVAGANTLVSLNSKSINAEQAKALEDTIGFLQSFGKGLLGKKKAYAALVENLKITRVGAEVRLDTQVPNAELAALLAAR